MSNSSVYIVAAQRTQIGKKNGGLKNFLAHDLGSHVIKSLIKKIDLEPKNIDEVIMGQVLTGNQGQIRLDKLRLMQGCQSIKPLT